MKPDEISLTKEKRMLDHDRQEAFRATYRVMNAAERVHNSAVAGLISKERAQRTVRRLAALANFWAGEAGIKIDWKEAFMDGVRDW